MESYWTVETTDLDTMTDNITANLLGIGLDNSVVNEIGASRPAQLITTESCLEAVNVLKLWDIDTIVIDGQTSQSLRVDIEKLLSVTPVTTRIVLITSPECDEDYEKLKGLGIKLISGPISSQDLTPYLH